MNSNDLAGKNILITGANTGIGKTTAQALAKRGAQLFLACRSRAKTEPVIAELKQQTNNQQIHFLELDLASLASVQAAAQKFLALKIPLHVLLNNAGLAGVKGLTQDGFEMAFGTNHLGHFLLTLLLHPALKNGAPSRVVTVSSAAHESPKSFDFETLKQSYRSVAGVAEYGRSKLANALMSAEIARRWKSDGIHSYSLHPGVVASDIWRGLPWPFRQLALMFMVTTEQGSVASIRCAASPEVASETGLYYGPSGKVFRHNPLVDDETLRLKLWTLSEDFVRPFFT